MWKNRHVIIAMLVAPLLAVGAWFAVDYMVAERAQAARPGAAYPLVAKSNCRYDSGQCDLVNSDLKLTLTPVELQDEQTVLLLESEFAPAQATIALASGDDEVVGTAVLQEPAEGLTRMTLTIPAYADPAATLRIAVTIQQSLYFAEVPAVFLRTGEPAFRR